MARVSFYHFNGTQGVDENPIDAVYCEELYAEQIAREQSGDVSSNDYTRAFTDVPYLHSMMELETNIKWICPNITSAFLDTK